MVDEYDALAERMQREIGEEHGFLSWLDVRVGHVEEGRVVLTIPFDEKLTNVGEPPTIQGGIAATLIDTAGGLAQRTTIDPDVVDTGVATITLEVNYLQRAAGDLTATAEVIRAGGTVGVSDVVVESDTGEGVETVAVGQPTFRLFRD